MGLANVGHLGKPCCPPSACDLAGPMSALKRLASAADGCRAKLNDHVWPAYNRSFHQQPFRKGNARSWCMQRYLTIAALDNQLRRLSLASSEARLSKREVSSAGLGEPYCLMSSSFAKMTRTLDFRPWQLRGARRFELTPQMQVKVSA